MKNISLIILAALFCVNANATPYSAKILDSTNPSGSVNSSLVDVSDHQHFSAHVVLTGTTACTSEIKVSNDTDAQTLTTLSSSSVAATTAGVMYSVDGNYKYMKVALTSCTGTGTAKIYFTAKD